MDRISDILQMLESSPADSFLHHALALEYLKKEAPESAKKAFLFNVENNPEYLGTYYHIGKLEEREGNTAQAISYYQQGMALAKKKNDQHTYNELQAAYEDLAY